MKEKLFLHYLKWRTRPALLRHHLEKKQIRGADNCAAVERRAIKVGAVQLQLQFFTSPLAYVDEMCHWAEEAAAAGVQLLVFPENNSFQLLGLLPGIEKLAGDGGDSGGNAGGGDAGGRVDAPPSVADVFRYAGPVFHRVMKETFPYLARKYGMYIMAGSFPYPQAGKVMNRSFLFGPGGDLLGSQDKVHLTSVEHQWGLERGDQFHVFDTPLGKLAMPVCMDATYFETFRILRGAGAEIIMIPIANPEPYNFWLALRGIWPRVQESLVYGIKSAMVGEIMGFTLTGRAGIFAPLELSPKGDGVLAEMEHPGREGLVTAVLDLDALHDLRQNHPYLEDKNPALRQKYFPHIYK